MSTILPVPRVFFKPLCGIWQGIGVLGLVALAMVGDRGADLEDADRATYKSALLKIRAPIFHHQHMLTHNIQWWEPCIFGILDLSHLN